jgi:hypothetical protein
VVAKLTIDQALQKDIEAQKVGSHQEADCLYTAFSTICLAYGKQKTNDINFKTVKCLSQASSPNFPARVARFIRRIFASCDRKTGTRTLYSQ